MQLWRVLPILVLTGCNGLALDSYMAAADGRDANDTAAGTSATPQPGASGSTTDQNTGVSVTASPTPSPSPTIFNCDTGTYPVCDGFELVAVGQPPDPNRWNSNVTLPPPGDPAVHSVNPNEDSILVSDKYAHTGKHSLWFHTVGDWEHIPIMDITSAMFPTPFLPAPNNTFFVRYWVYHDPLMPGSTTPQTQFNSGGHWYMVNASGPLDGRQQYQKFGGGGPNLGWNYYGGDEGIGSAQTWPLGEWNCFEAEFKGNTAELHLFKNDTEVTDMESAPGNWAAPDYNRLTIGWEMDHPSSAPTYTGADVYIDDVAYSYTRIYCATPQPTPSP